MHYNTPTFQQIDICSQLGVICKFTDGGLNPLIQIISKDIKQDWPQQRSLRDTTSDWPQTGCSTVHHHSLGLAIQPFLNPEKSAPVKAVGCQLLQEYALEDSVKGLAEVQVDNIHSLPCIHQADHLVIKGDQKKNKHQDYYTKFGNQNLANVKPLHVANKLRNYESMVNGPMHAHVSAVIKCQVFSASSLKTIEAG
ncbi:hypothetical protein DUI87_19235 [Hirundo rustica rustica]|uniref:Uncharacterized protein n=1 Tax=Hirundo rustica rustica TaxID=333673 RepID=A0A3M0JTN8_HIRRU|nr:hypothetical protein DUI87_19235 [Hirundo rustica rustica]